MSQICVPVRRHRPGRDLLGADPAQRDHGLDAEVPRSVQIDQGADEELRVVGMRRRERAGLRVLHSTDPGPGAPRGTAFDDCESQLDEIVRPVAGPALDLGHPLRWDRSHTV